MQVYCTFWDGSSWATRGGRAKVDYSLAAFTASYQIFNAQACIWSSGSSSSSCSNNLQHNSWLAESLGRIGHKKLKWVQQKFMTYDYCTDVNHFPKGLPPECKLA